MDLFDVLDYLRKTDIPNIIVVAGLIFIFLAVGGRLGASVGIDRTKQAIAGGVGAALLILGLGLYLLPELRQKRAVDGRRVESETSAAAGNMIEAAHAAWRAGEYGELLEWLEIIVESGADQEEIRLASRRLDWLRPIKGRIVFADDFEEQTLDDESKWILSPPGPGSGAGTFERVRDDGNYALEGTGHFHAKPKIGPGRIDEHFEIELRFRPLQPLERAAAFVNLMWEPRRVSIALAIPDRVIGLTWTADERLVGVTFEPRWYSLRAVMHDGALRLFLDGREVLEHISAQKIWLEGFDLEILSGKIQFDDVLIVATD